MAESPEGARRRIAVVAPWFFGGGAQAALIGVLRKLRAAGAEVRLVVLFAGSTGIDALRPYASDVVELGCPKTPAGVLEAVRRVGTHLRDADAVYSLMRASHVVLGVLPSRALPAGRPFVASFHQLPSSDSAGVVGKMEDLLVRRAMRRATLLTAPSRRAVAELDQLGFADPARIRYEANALAPRALEPTPPRSGELSRVRLFFAGRLTDQKGLDRLADLLGELERPVEVRIAGSGPDEERIRASLASLDGRHQVVFLGELDDVTSHLDWCDALLMPSRAELNPVFLWEGRQRGRGALTSDIPAFLDLAEEGGILAFSDSAGFRAGVEEIATDEELRESWFADLRAVAEPLADPDAPSEIVDELLARAPQDRRRSGVLVLHGYSADNAGDGLLVRETLDIVREALGDVPISLIASRPETFQDLDVDTFPAVPGRTGWDPRTRALLKRIDDFDLAIAVGGGYLRAGTPVELLKTALVHGPQLIAASRASIPTIYLPQSVGPARYGTRGWVRRRLARIDRVMLRDDRSVAEFSGPSVERVPDLATSGAVAGRRPGSEVDDAPVLSIRAVHGRINPDIYRLAARLGDYDGYIQSTTGGNDDRPAAATLSPRRTIERADLMTSEATPRVVVAVRLHAALMALAAGHYVVHLAYERKGFGAFGDLGIDPWVHNVNSFDPIAVAEQARELLSDPAVRADYDARIAAAGDRIAQARAEIVRRVQDAGGER